jgi:hypothetical protein
MDKFAEFLNLAKDNPELLGQLGGLLEGFGGESGDEKKESDLFGGVADLAGKFGIDLTPDDVADAKTKAQAKNDDADDSFGFDDIAGLAGKFLGGGNSSGKDDGFGLDDIGSMLGGMLGGDDKKNDSKADSDSGFNPLDLLVSMFNK